jgi:hypothetical protein
MDFFNRPYDTKEVHHGVPRAAMQDRYATELEIPIADVQEYILMRAAGEHVKVGQMQYRIGQMYRSSPRSHYVTAVLHKMRTGEPIQWQV